MASPIYRGKFSIKICCNVMQFITSLDMGKITSILMTRMAYKEDGDTTNTIKFVKNKQKYALNYLFMD